MRGEGIPTPRRRRRIDALQGRPFEVLGGSHPFGPIEYEIVWVDVATGIDVVTADSRRLDSAARRVRRRGERLGDLDAAAEGQVVQVPAVLSRLHGQVDHWRTDVARRGAYDIAGGDRGGRVVSCGRVG